MGEIVLALLHPDADCARRNSTSSRSTPSGRTCRRKRKNALLHGSGDDEIKFSYEDGVRSYDTKKPFEGVVTNLERRFRETESEWAREELGKYFSDVPCGACHGHRLKPEALCVKIGGKHIGEISELSIRRAVTWVEEVPKQLNSQQNEIAVRDAEGNPRAAVLPGRCRPRLSHSVARLRHAVRRRKPAHPPRLADRLGADRRALRAGRAVDRPASARQCAAARDAAAAARPRQHRDRGRARRGRHPQR